MHFSIPETEDVKDKITGKSITLYKININGAHHCSVRFSELLDLNNQLHKQLSLKIDFPTKILFKLSGNEIYERKMKLEKYLQTISQDQRVLQNRSFINFFLHSQKSKQIVFNELNVKIDIYLLNGDKIELNNINAYEKTEELLEKTCSLINLETDLCYYFGLYLIKKDKNNSILVIRKLQDFESPYISLKEANKSEPHKIALRKSILDINLEKKLLNSQIACNLLYIQSVFEYKIGWIVPSDYDISNNLNLLIENDDKKGFIDLIRIQKYYGYLHFKDCSCDYMKNDAKIEILIGNRSLVVRGEQKEDLVFKITRVKCWKITNSVNNKLEISFEYLISKNNLRWIKIISEQAILISMCLQNMVDEIIMVRDNKSVKTPDERLTSEQNNNNIKMNNLMGTNLSMTRQRNKSNSISNDDDFNNDNISDNDL